MNSKKLMSAVLVSAMVCGTAAGCSKSNVRKIEGASDDACKLVSVIEEVYDMKGYAAEASMDFSATSKVSDKDVDVSYKMTEKYLLDESGNVRVLVNLDLNSSSYKINGDVAGFYFVDNKLYIDLSGAYTIIENAFGTATLGQILSMANLTADDIKSNLCFSLSTGDFKASDIKLDDAKAFAQPILDDIAVAISDAGVLAVDGKSYTLNISKSAATAVAKSFSKAFAANGEKIIGEVISYLEKLNVADKGTSMVQAIVNDVAPALKDVLGADISESFKSDEVKKSIEEVLKKLTDEKAEIAKKIAEQAEAGQIATDDANVDMEDVKVVITDTDNGYDISMDLSAKGSTDTVEASGSGNVTVKVAKSSEKVTAPENSKSIGDVVKVAGSIAMMFLSGAGN